MSSYMYSIHFVYHLQVGQTPLLRAVNGVINRAGRYKVVKYFVEKKKMGITQFSQVIQS